MKMLVKVKQRQAGDLDAKAHLRKVKESSRPCPLRKLLCEHRPCSINCTHYHHHNS